MRYQRPVFRRMCNNILPDKSWLLVGRRSAYLQQHPGNSCNVINLKLEYMKTRNLIVTFLLASLVGVLAIACSAKVPVKVRVDKDISVAVYSTVDKGGTIDTVSPCLLTETVHVSELLRYPEDDGITMPFTLSDTARYAEITGNNLEKRIAISVNGQVLSTPVVKMKIGNGACSVILNEKQTKDLFPTINIEELNSTNR